MSFWFHRHDPCYTGREIEAEFGKDNLPNHIKPIRARGLEAYCGSCGQHLIVHMPGRFVVKFTELAA